MPAGELHLVYSATSFAAWTRVYCVSKTFEDDLKTNPNNNCKRRVFIICGERRGKTVTMRFGNVIVGMIMSALKRSQTGSLSVTKRRRRNTALFLFSKIN